MHLLDRITIQQGGVDRSIELLFGDLANTTPEFASDVLIVSSFGGDYRPTPHSMIGALSRKGISVEELALQPEVDLRQTFSCWISKALNDTADAPYGRLVCMETLNGASPVRLVAQAFRALCPFVLGPPFVSSVSMPLLATGDQAFPVDTMLRAILNASIDLLTRGLPLNRIRIAVHSPSQVALAHRQICIGERHPRQGTRRAKIVRCLSELFEKRRCSRDRILEVDHRQRISTLHRHQRDQDRRFMAK